LRKKSPKCVVCGENPSITQLIDYEEFCGVPSHDQVQTINDILLPDQHISCLEYSKLQKDHILLDVRSNLEVEICCLPNSTHIPLQELEKRWMEVQQLVSQSEEQLPVYCLCRRGVRSQVAVKFLEEKGISATNIVGGLISWIHEVDPSFPQY